MCLQPPSAPPAPTVGPGPRARSGPGPHARTGGRRVGPETCGFLRRIDCARILIEGARFPPFGFEIAEISWDWNEDVSFFFENPYCARILIEGARFPPFGFDKAVVSSNSNEHVWWWVVWCGVVWCGVVWCGVVWCGCLLYTSPSPRDGLLSRMPSSA